METASLVHAPSQLEAYLTFEVSHRIQRKSKVKGTMRSGLFVAPRISRFLILQEPASQTSGRPRRSMIVMVENRQGPNSGPTILR